MFNFGFQLHYVWVDAMPYAMSLWDMSEIPFVTNNLTLNQSNESSLLEKSYVNHLDLTDNPMCVLMTTMSPHIDYIQWKYIPCNKLLDQNLVICEENIKHEQATLDLEISHIHDSINRTRKVQASMKFIKFIPSKCGKHFIYWNGSCIRILHWRNSSHLQAQNMAQCMDVFPPLNTDLSAAEWTRRWIYILLEKLRKNPPTDCKQNYKVKNEGKYKVYGRKFRYGGRCSYVRYTASHDKIQWDVHYDCSLVKQNHIFVCKCGIDDYEGV